MNRKCIIKFLLMFLVVVAAKNEAQEKLTRQKALDAFAELETDSLVLRFYDALTGMPITKADVYIDSTEQTVTDFEGRAFFKKPVNDGILKIKFMHPKYIPSDFDIEVMAGTIFFNRFSISPLLPIGALRVVLDWGENPKDLDAHLIKKNDYHISYRNMKVSNDGIAKLDRDDTDSFGPETITANSVDKNAEYVFFVHDYSSQSDNQSSALSNSGASIKIFGDNRLIELITIPKNMTGNYWEVFRIINGRIVKISAVNNEAK